jgi:hypothetical protein
VALDVADREVVQLRCDRCGRRYDRVVVFVKQDGDAYAIVSAACHGHDDREVWIDATLGSWVEPFDDHITMSCRVSGKGATAVDALVASRGEANYYGHRLTGEQTLSHPRAPELWDLVDSVVTAVPEVQAAIGSEE